MSVLSGGNGIADLSRVHQLTDLGEIAHPLWRDRPDQFEDVGDAVVPDGEYAPGLGQRSRLRVTVGELTAVNLPAIRSRVWCG